MSYRLLPHTADLRAVLDAPSLDELYETAATLVREIVVGASPVASGRQRSIVWDHSEPGERFFRFVRELLYLYDVEGFIPGDLQLGAQGVVVRGERFESKRHEAHHQVKALTRHGFVFEETSEGCRAELVFDL